MATSTNACDDSASPSEAARHDRRDRLPAGQRAGDGVVERLALRESILSSEVVRFEILAGARADELEAIERFCSALAWLPIDAEVSRAAGALARRYRASFSGIDDVDYLIAASAIVASADLLTTNVRRYPMFAALEPPY